MEIDWKAVWWQRETLNVSDATLLLLGENPDDYEVYLRAEVKGYKTLLRELIDEIRSGNLPAKTLLFVDDGARLYPSSQIAYEEIELFFHLVTAVASSDLKAWAAHKYKQSGKEKETDKQFFERMKNDGKSDIEIVKVLLKEYPTITGYRVGKLFSTRHETEAAIRKRGQRLKQKAKEML